MSINFKTEFRLSQQKNASSVNGYKIMTSLQAKKRQSLVKELRKNKLIDKLCPILTRKGSHASVASV